MPSWVGRTVIAIAVLLLALFVVRGSCSGYDSRARVSDAMAESAPLKAQVEEFHRKRGALPEGAEAAAFRVEAGKLKAARRIENPRHGELARRGRSGRSGH